MKPNTLSSPRKSGGPLGTLGPNLQLPHGLCHVSRPLVWKVIAVDLGSSKTKTGFFTGIREVSDIFLIFFVQALAVQGSPGFLWDANSVLMISGLKPRICAAKFASSDRHKSRRDSNRFEFRNIPYTMLKLLDSD